MLFSRPGVSALEAWRVSKIWLLRCLIGLLVFVPCVIGLPFSSTSLARDRAPSVLTELRMWVASYSVPKQPQPPSAATVLTDLRIWVATHSGPKQPQLSASIQSGPFANPVVNLPPSNTTTQAPALSALATRPAATVNYPSGCAAALAYLAAYAAPGFVASCPHPDGGYQATTTCMGAPQCEPGTAFIWIEDPCPAAYMNEASNSWVLIGKRSAPIDPYGYCGERGNPYG